MKTWYGTMEISPKGMAPFQVTGEWEYKAEFDCWYCGANSFPAEICRKVTE